MSCFLNYQSTVTLPYTHTHINMSFLYYLIFQTIIQIYNKYVIEKEKIQRKIFIAE